MKGNNSPIGFSLETLLLFVNIEMGELFFCHLNESLLTLQS
jgi:hypothetical protein